MLKRHRCRVFDMTEVMNFCGVTLRVSLSNERHLLIRVKKLETNDVMSLYDYGLPHMVCKDSICFPS